jgi:hypothetical protein
MPASGAGWLFIAYATLAAPAGPDARAFELTWEAPSPCPGARELTRFIEADLGPSPPAQTVVAAGRVTEEGSGFRLQLEVTTSGGRTQDELRDVDCNRLAEAAALKIGLAIEQAATASSLRPPAPAAAPTDDEHPLDAQEKPPAPAAKAFTPVAQLRAAAGIDWGSLPGVGFVVDAGVGLVRWPRWRLELGLVYAPPRRFWQTDDASLGGELAAVGGILRGGPVLGQRSVRFALEGAVELAAVLARPFGGSRAQAVFRAALWLAPSLVWQQGRLSLWVTPALGVPVTRYRFVAGNGVEYRARPVALRGSLGVGVAL